jgi:hypothetical protein
MESRMNIEEKVENQILITKLLNGTATQPERDKALATVMLSLWGQRELRDLIRLVHKEECDKCPLKRDDTPLNSWKKVAMTLMQYLGWGILIVAGILNISLK